jgi:hypothetical protein
MAADDRHDLFPDIGRQAVPARDQLAQSQIGADGMQTGRTGVDATIVPHIDLRKSGRACNSRRVHSLCYKLKDGAPGTPTEIVVPGIIPNRVPVSLLASRFHSRRLAGTCPLDGPHAPCACGSRRCMRTAAASRGSPQRMRQFTKCPGSARCPVEPGGHPRQTKLTRPSPDGAPLADALSREAYRQAEIDQ